jgi:hypothetical protein
MDDSLSIDEFIKIFENFGYDLIIYYTFIYEKYNLNMYVDKQNCWYGSKFFTALLTNTTNLLRETNYVISNRIYIGHTYLSQEEHHFMIITNDNYAYVFNTYYGQYGLKIIKHKIKNLNNLFLMINQKDIFTKIFGFFPKFMTINENIIPEIELDEYSLILPSKQEMLIFFNDIKENLNNINNHFFNNLQLNIINL